VSHNNQQYCTLAKNIHSANDLSNSYPESLTEKNYQDLFYYKQTLLLAFHLAYSINKTLLISIQKSRIISAHTTLKNH